MSAYTYQTNYLPAVQVMSIKADSFPKGIITAFARLENTLPSLKGRRFYGVYCCVDTTIEYRACVLPLVEGEFDLYGLERFIIPAGQYAQIMLGNWQTNPPQIKTIFADMAQHFIEDTSRPQVAFYKNANEMWLYLPIL